jgi:Tfp pilus assembly protein FimV
MNISVSEIADAVTNSRYLNLSYEVIAQGASYHLKIRSRGVVREPILSFQVELDWSIGHLLRNYALIIDPQ